LFFALYSCAAKFPQFEVTLQIKYHAISAAFGVAHVLLSACSCRVCKIFVDDQLAQKTIRPQSCEIMLLESNLTKSKHFVAELFLARHVNRWVAWPDGYGATCCNDENSKCRSLSSEFEWIHLFKNMIYPVEMNCPVATLLSCVVHIIFLLNRLTLS
jgi:hypothetical protein